MITVPEAVAEIIERPGRTFTAKIDFGADQYTGIVSMIRTATLAPNSTFVIGEAVGASLEIDLTDRLTNVANNEFFASISIAAQEFPLGYFIAEKPLKSGNISHISAYDRMALADRFTYQSALTYPTTVSAVFAEIVQTIDSEYQTVTLAATDDLPITEDKLSGFSCRDALAYLAAYIGANCAVDTAGKFRMVKYVDATSYELKDNTMESPDFADETTVISGLACTVDTETKLTAGSMAEPLSFICPIMTQERLNAILAQLSAAPLYQYTAASVNQLCGDPRIELGDVITVIHNGESIIVPVMSLLTDFDGGLIVNIQSFDVSDTSDLTLAQKIDIAYRASQDTSKYAQETEVFTQAISNSSGLHRTEIEQKDGSVKYYFHNGATLDASTYIFTMTDAGIAWANGPNCWNNGNPVWTTGVSSTGKAILQALSAYNVTADIIDTGELVIKDAEGKVVHKFSYDDLSAMIGGEDGIKYDADDKTTYIGSNVVISGEVSIGGSKSIGETISDAVDDAVADLDIKEIDRQEFKYAITEDASTIPGVSAWKTSFPTDLASHKGEYLWTKTITVYSDGNDDSSYQATYIGDDGAPGAPGKSVTVSSIKYAKNTDQTTQPGDSAFSDSLPTNLSPGDWLWTKTTFSDGSTAVTKSYIGTDGKDGKGISRTVITYGIGSSGTSAEGVSFGASIPDTSSNKGKYLWTKTEIYYTDKPSIVGSTALSVAYIASNGSNGRGVSSITQYFYASDKDTIADIPAVDSGDWKTSPSDFSSGKEFSETRRFLWTFTRTVYTNPSGTADSARYILGVWGSKGGTGTGTPGRGIKSIEHQYCLKGRNQQSFDFENVTTAGNFVEMNTVEFIPAQSGKYTFTSNNDFDTVGYIFNNEGTPLVTDDDSGSNRQFKIEYNMTAGTLYYLGVRVFTASVGKTVNTTIQSEEYSTDWSSQAPPYQQGLDYYERDKVVWTDSETPEYLPNENGAKSTGLSEAIRIANELNADYAKFVIKDGNRTYINGSKIFTGSVTASDIAAYNAMIRNLLANYARVDGNLDVIDGDITITSPLSDGFTREQSFREYLDEYCLKTYTKDVSESLSYSATSSSVTNKYFNPSVSGTYTFKSTNGSSSLDPIGYVYDSSGTQIATNDDTDGRNFSISFDAVAGKTYQLGVKLYSSGSTTSGTVEATISHKEGVHFDDLDAIRKMLAFLTCFSSYMVTYLSDYVSTIESKTSKLTVRNTDANNEHPLQARLYPTGLLMTDSETGESSFFGNFAKLSGSCYIGGDLSVGGRFDAYENGSVSFTTEENRTGYYGSVSFSQSYSSAPNVQLTPQLDSGMNGYASTYNVTETGFSWNIHLDTYPSANQTYTIKYLIIP